MTDDIIKALEDEIERRKAICSDYDTVLIMTREYVEDIIKAYKSQQAEIEMLKADKEALINGQETLQKNLPKVIRAEAIKEFAETIAGAIDYIKKEMVGDNNGKTRRA